VIEYEYVMMSLWRCYIYLAC